MQAEHRTDKKSSQPRAADEGRAPARLPKHDWLAGGLINFWNAFREEYYHPMRLAGYAMAAYFTKWGRALGNWKEERDNERAQDKNPLASPFMRKKSSMSLRMIRLQNKLQNTEEGPRRERLQEKFNEMEAEFQILNIDDDNYRQARKTDYIDWGKKVMSRLETPVFLGITAWMAWKDRKRMRNDFSNALGAEFGIKPDEVNREHFKKSQIEMVRDSRARYLFQLFTRGVTDLGFLWNVNFGIVVKALSITIERLSYIGQTPFGRMKDTVTRIQKGELQSKVATAKLKEQFLEIFQQERHAQKGIRITDAELEQISPLVDDMAAAVLAHKIGVNEIVYMLGIGLNEKAPQASREIFDRILDIGLEGIAEQKLTRQFLDRQLKEVVINGEEKRNGKIEAVEPLPETASRPTAQESILTRGMRNPLLHAADIGPTAQFGR